MSLVGTLAKVAIGVVIAKGVGSMIQKGRESGTGTPNAGGGSVFGGPHSPGGTGLDDMMGEVLAGGPGGTVQNRRSAPAEEPLDQGVPGGLGGLLEELAGGRRTAQPNAAPAPSPGGGLDDLLGQLGGMLGGTASGAGTTGGTTPAGMPGGSLGDLLGGLLGGLAGGAMGGTQPPARADTSFGDMLNQSLRNRGEPSVQPTAGQDAAAALMLRSMLMAAKCDGRIDEAEKQKLLGNLGEITPAEKRFIEAELAAPVDVEGLARQVPRGLEPQVYTMSVMAIDLDSQAEARYLDALAKALGVGRDEVNHIHDRLGLPALYR